MKEFKERFKELGVDDWAYNENLQMILYQLNRDLVKVKDLLITHLIIKPNKEQIKESYIVQTLDLDNFQVQYIFLCLWFKY